MDFNEVYILKEYCLFIKILINLSNEIDSLGLFPSVRPKSISYSIVSTAHELQSSSLILLIYFTPK